MSAVLKPRVDKSEITAECYAQLREELVAALTNNVQTYVQTPGFNQAIKYTTAAAVVLDDLEAGNAALHELLSIVGDASQGHDVQLRASAWIAARANKHAQFHCADLADEVMA